MLKFQRNRTKPSLRRKRSQTPVWCRWIIPRLTKPELEVDHLTFEGGGGG